jgi:hypothetical protein
MIYYICREGIDPKGKEVRNMYEVTTTKKTLIKTDDLNVALTIAEIAFESHNYVEVKENVTPWYAVSVKIFYR